METNNIIPFAFTEGQSPKDKSQNIIKVIGVGGGGRSALGGLSRQLAGRTSESGLDCNGFCGHQKADEGT